MSKRDQMTGLADLAQLLLDERLARLRSAAELRDQSLVRLAALDRCATPQVMPPIAAEQVALRYQAWADARRSEINTLLARQIADWMDAREGAARAFGRAEALRRLAQRQATRR